MSYIVLDLETGIKEGYGRKGNPWLNEIVAIGLKHEEFEKPLATLVRSQSEKWDFDSWLASFLEGTNLLIGHNIKFDLLYLWKSKALQDWIRAGGRIWDTQLAEYYLTDLQSKMSKLRTIAVEKYGCKERQKHMEEYWDKGIDTKDIPLELVLADVISDVMDTEMIYNLQLIDAAELKMLPLIQGHMEGLLATCEMEYNGMTIDRKKLQDNRFALQKELEEALNKLNEVVKPYWSK